MIAGGASGIAVPRPAQLPAHPRPDPGEGLVDVNRGRAPSAGLVDSGMAAPLTAAEKLRITLDLCAAGEDVMRQNLRRRHPEAGESEIERRLCAWLRERPGAEDGDAEGRRGPWPRAKS